MRSYFDKPLVTALATPLELFVKFKLKNNSIHKVEPCPNSAKTWLREIVPNIVMSTTKAKISLAWLHLTPYYSMSRWHKFVPFPTIVHEKKIQNQLLVYFKKNEIKTIF